MSDVITRESNGESWADWDAGDPYNEDDDDFDCGMDKHGACGKAGSEECEFECPYNE